MEMMELVCRAYPDRTAFLRENRVPALVLEPYGEDRALCINTPSTPVARQETWRGEAGAPELSEVLHPEALVAWLNKSDRNPFSGIITLGRARNNDIILHDPTVSKLHALMHQKDGQWFIEDRHSTNGTSVNGLLMPPDEPWRVLDGVRVQLGFGLLARFYTPTSLWSFREQLRALPPPEVPVVFPSRRMLEAEVTRKVVRPSA